MRVRSLSHAYEVAAGHPMAGRTREAAGTATFVQALANALNISLVSAYAQAEYFEWTVTRSVRATDFRARRAITVSQTPPSLPIVAEGGDFVEVMTPSEQGAAYSIAKRRALLTLSLELIRNDNITLVARMVENLGRAARRSYAELIWSLWTSNANSSDATPWFSASHGNTGTLALDPTSVISAVKQLLEQHPLGSTERIGVPFQPGRLYLVCSSAAWDAACHVNQTQTVNAAAHHVFGSQNENVIVNPLLEGTAWGVHRRATDVPSIESAFLDGQEEPELSLADDPRAGALFSEDRLRYKVKHTFGACVVDHRGAVKQVPA
jgi:hypothetical protein